MKVLREVLLDGGFKGDHLMEIANSTSVKEQLKVNTKRSGNHDHVIHDVTPPSTVGLLIMDYVEYQVSKLMIIKQ